MGKFDKLFDDKTVKIMAGDLPAGEWQFDMNTLWGPFDQINLEGQISTITQQTEESVKQLTSTLGWGLAGAVALGPVGMLAGLVLGGNRKQICALIELKDGRKFLATMDSKVFQQMLALSLTK